MENLFEKVRKLLKEGKSRTEIANMLDLQKSVVNYYANPKNWEKFLRKEKIQNKRNSFEESILEVLDHASSLSNICDLIGIHHTNVNINRVAQFLEEKGINPEWKQKQSQRKPTGYWTKDTIFVEKSKFQRSKLKDKLIEFNIKTHKCEICGNATWMDQPIPLQIHHVNGINDDNRIQNLQLLCPNCHALTDNYCGKNIDFSNSIKLQSSKTTKEQKSSLSESYSYEFLKEKLYSDDFENFDKLAEELKIGRRTLQKICREKGLPGSKTEMGLISKERLKPIICQHCGNTFRPAHKHAKFCSLKCFRKANNQPEFGTSLSKEEILKEVHNHNSMSSLAKYFGYKDIRSQCRRNGLPLSIEKLKQLI